MSNGQKLIGPTSQSERFRVLDARGVIARRMKAIEGELITALGGEDQVTPQQMLLIEGIAVRVMRRSMFVNELAESGELSTESERRLNWHLCGIRADLQLLGLERREKEIPSLHDVLSGTAE